MRKYLLFLLLCLSVSLSFAQESTEAPAEQTQEAATPPAEITAETSPSPEVTQVVLPTIEAPTAQPTEEASAYVPAPEPALSLYASDSFEGGRSNQWQIPSDWLANGTSLTLNSANSGFFSAQSFTEVAVQAQFQLSPGATVSLFVRDNYRASLNAEGRLSLWRDETELASTTITLNPAGHYLRLSAFGDTLRLSLDAQPMLVAQDATYSAGRIGLRLDFSAPASVTLDNFGVWIPTSMMPVAPAEPSRMPQSGGASTQALSAPNLIAPALNAIVTKLRPNFSWQAVSGAVQYQLRIATNFSCSTVYNGTQGEILTNTSSIVLDFDLPQGEYWYCVQAKDINNTWSGFGEKRRFVVNISTLPAHQTVISNSMNVNLSWTAIAGASYDLEVATDSSFTSYAVVANDITTTSYLATLPYGQYYWRVAVNDVQLPMSLARNFYISPPLPVAAANLPPLNNGKYTNDVSPTLNWTVPSNWVPLPAAQSVTYELQLSTVNTFSSLIAGTSITGIGTNNHEWTATNLADGRYYWRVRAITNLGLAGAWSAAFNFYVDTAAQLEPAYNSPADDGFVATARPAFSWKTAVGANRYLLEVSTVEDFSSTVISVTQSATTYTATSSLGQGEYFWRVLSLDAAGNYSAIPGTVRSFTIDYRTAPRSEQVFVSATPRTVNFTWALVQGATGAIYTVEISVNEDFSTIDYTSPGRSTGSWTSPALGQGRYYWRLVVTGYGTTGARPFIISPALPNAPALTSPANNANTNDVSPVLQWNAPTVNGGGVSYQLQISTNSSFTALVGGTISLATTNHTINPDLPLTSGTLYYWRVRAVTNLQAPGAWSTARVFRLDTSAQAAPPLVSPINGADVTSTTPQLKWTAVAGANRYEVRYGLSADLSAVTPILVTTTAYTIPTPLILDSYYWEVRSLDAAGNVGAWSGVEDFDVVSPATAVSRSWFFTTSTPTLSWTPLYWADVYQIEVSTTSNFSNIVFTTTTANETTLSVTTTSLADGVYYFRVRAQSQPEAGGAWGSWSATETFSIDAP